MIFSHGRTRTNIDIDNTYNTYNTDNTDNTGNTGQNDVSPCKSVAKK